jgi:hypothetical protein
MKALKLAVAEPSAILRCGIIAVLRRLPAPDVDILEIADISQLTVQLSRHRPDVLVVNPASLGFCTPATEGANRLRGPALHCVANVRDGRRDAQCL